MKEKKTKKSYQTPDLKTVKFGEEEIFLKTSVNGTDFTVGGGTNWGDFFQNGTNNNGGGNE